MTFLMPVSTECWKLTSDSSKRMAKNRRKKHRYPTSLTVCHDEKNNNEQKRPWGCSPGLRLSPYIGRIRSPSYSPYFQVFALYGRYTPGLYNLHGSDIMIIEMQISPHIGQKKSDPSSLYFHLFASQDRCIPGLYNAHGLQITFIGMEFSPYIGQIPIHHTTVLPSICLAEQIYPWPTQSARLTDHQIIFIGMEFSLCIG